MLGPNTLSAPALGRMRSQAGAISRAAIADVEARHPWYSALGAEDRSSVALVAHRGVENFLGWLSGDAETPDVDDIFSRAPRELARAITLAQTVDLVRSVVDVVDAEAVPLVGEGEAPILRAAVLHYSREVAFGAAHVYAATAEMHGAWEARLEALVVDAVLRGDADSAIQSRAAALGWGATTGVAVIAGSPPATGDVVEPERILARLHATARRADRQILAAVQAGRVICLVGGTSDALADARLLLDCFGDGPLVVGPTVPHLFAAGRSARAAIAGHAAAHAWPQAPRPAHADELLAERSLIGDIPARNALVSRIARPLAAQSGADLLATAAAYLAAGGNLESTARTLIVHPNTVRYRLGRIADTTGYDLTDAHDALIVRLALSYGLLADAGITGTASIARR